ncbi:energy transducer TonB [bacterium]|nr:energy transducer TonB [bacterium]
MRIDICRPCVFHRGVFFSLIFLIGIAPSILSQVQETLPQETLPQENPSRKALPTEAQRFGTRPAEFDQPQAPTEEAVRLLEPLEVEYPDWAMRQRIEGVSIVAVWIDAKGAPAYGELRESSGHAVLDSIALRAVRRGIYKAARREGTNVASRVSIPVEFRLRRDEDHYDATKSGEQLEQESEELRRARDMLHEEQQRLEAERKSLEEELKRLRAEKKKAEENK